MIEQFLYEEWEIVKQMGVEDVGDFVVWVNTLTNYEMICYLDRAIRKATRGA